MFIEWFVVDCCWVGDVDVRLKKTGNTLIGNMLERLKKDESDVYYGYMIVFNA